MKKFKVPIPGTIGKSIKLETGLEPRVSALEAAFAALKTAKASQYHKDLLGLQVGNDHPQYPLKLGRETIKGQWDFTQQIWADLGDEYAPGISFTAIPDSGFFANDVDGDPQFHNVVLLIRASDAGSVGSTAFVDASQYERPLTVNETGGGTFRVSSLEAKFGSTSLRDIGSGAFISFDDTSAPELQAITTARYWCQEAWLWIHSGIGGGFISKNNFTTLFPSICDFVTANTPRWRGDDNVNAYNMTSPVPFPDTGLSGAFAHMALVRDDDQFVMYLNGTEVVRDVWNGDLSNQTGGGRLWLIGGASGDMFWDQIRWTMSQSDPGAARYTSNFTPPDEPFADTGGEVYVSVSVDAQERFRFGDEGQLGIGGSVFGTSRQSFLSGGNSAPPVWADLVHTDIVDWDEAVMDTVAANLDNTTSVVWDYGDSDGSLKAFVPAEYVQDVVGAMAVDSTTIDFTYSDLAGTLSAAVIQSANYSWSGNHDFTGGLLMDGSAGIAGWVLTSLGPGFTPEWAPGGGGGGSGSFEFDATFVTIDDERGTYPNSFRLVEGDNITIEETTDGEVRISSTGGGGGGSGGPVARIFASSTQNFTTAVATAVTFTSAQYDDDAMFDIGDPTKLSAPTGAGGWYVGTASMRWASQTGGYRRLALRVNGADVYETNSTNSPSGVDSPFLSISALLPLHEGDYVELIAYQDSGSTVASVSGTAMMSLARMFDAEIAGPDDPPVSPDAMDDEFNGSSLDAKWTWRNQGTSTAAASATVSGGSCLLASGSTASSPTIQAIEQSFSGTARFRCKMVPNTPNNFNIVGLFLRDSGTGRSMSIGNHHNGSGQRRLVSRWNSDTSYGGSLFEDANGTYPTAVYLEVEITATALFFRWSNDGVNFTQLFTESLASFLANPDTVMLGVVTFGGGNNASESVDWFRRFA